MVCLVFLVAMAGPMGVNLTDMESCWTASRLYFKLDIDAEDVDGMCIISAVVCLLGPDSGVRNSALELTLSTGRSRESETQCSNPSHASTDCTLL